MAWCWDLGFMERCCRWSKTAEYEGVWSGGGWWLLSGGMVDYWEKILADCLDMARKNRPPRYPKGT